MSISKLAFVLVCLLFISCSQEKSLKIGDRLPVNTNDVRIHYMGDCPPYQTYQIIERKLLWDYFVAVESDTIRCIWQVVPSNKDYKFNPCPPKF